MLEDYLNKPVTVKLVTGETLQGDIRFYGVSPLNTGMLWFVIPRPSNPLESEKEFHVPVTSIASLDVIR